MDFESLPGLGDLVLTKNTSDCVGTLVMLLGEKGSIAATALLFPAIELNEVSCSFKGTPLELEDTEGCRLDIGEYVIHSYTLGSRHICTLATWPTARDKHSF